MARQRALSGAERSAGTGLSVASERDAVQLHPMINEAEPELLRDPPLQQFQFLVDELDHGTGFDIDQMVVMSLRRRFKTGPSVAELMPLQYARFLEQAHCSVDSSDRNMRVDCRSARMHRLDVWMVLGFGQHARNHAALLGDPEPLVVAEGFNVDPASHHWMI